jgi:hypothetical protein
MPRQLRGQGRRLMKSGGWERDGQIRTGNARI